MLLASPTLNRTAEGITTHCAAEDAFATPAATPCAADVLANRVEELSDCRGGIPLTPPPQHSSKFFAAAPEAGKRGERGEARGPVDGVDVEKAAMGRRVTVAPIYHGLAYMQADEVPSFRPTTRSATRAEDGRWCIIFISNTLLRTEH